MIKRIITTLVAGAVLALTGATAAHAATPWDVPVKDSATCPNATGWGVGEDEKNLIPTQVPEGFQFKDASLVHHLVEKDGGLTLAEVRPGSFVADLVDGSMPLIKLETTSPYTTINQTPDGKFWATAMTYDQEGGQGHPVDTVADLADKPTKDGVPPLDAGTRVRTFGIGYANDNGNQAVVRSLTFQGKTYALSCSPVTETTKPNPGNSTSAPAGGHPQTTRPHTTASTSHPVAVPDAGPSLPVTGAPVALISITAAIVILAGFGLVMLTRRRRITFKN